MGNRIGNYTYHKLIGTIKRTILRYFKDERIEVGNRIGIGTDNAQDQLHIESATGGSIELDRKDSSITDTSVLGNIYFGGTNDGTTYDYGARITAKADLGFGEWAPATAVPTKLEFETNPTGSSTRATRMVINASGSVGINTSTPRAKLEVESTRDLYIGSGSHHNYHLLLRASDNENYHGVGLGFARSANSAIVGASIIFRRTGGGSIGDLDFYTKQGTGNGVGNELVMKLTDGGFVGINTSGSTAPLSPLSIKQTTDNEIGAITIMESTDSDDVWSIHRTATYLKFNRATDGSTFSDIGYINPASAPGQIDFTGQHRSAPYTGSVSDYEDKTGLIVIASGEHFSLSDSSEINIDESLPTVKLAEKRNDKRSFGVVSGIEDPANTQRTYSAGSWGTSYEKRADDHRLIINSLGEGAVWVSDINGNLENGDYITTCEIPGYGMKQSDDLLHNYTVAKITQDCSFELTGSTYQCKEINFSGSVHKVAFVGCTYHCG